MIKLTDIKIALNDKLKDSFPSIPVKAQDVTKGFARPSFTTYIDEPKIVQLETQIETAATIIVYYFPDLKTTEKSIDVLDMQWELPTLIGNKLHVADRALNVNEPSSNIVDGILVFEFDILFYQAYESKADQTAELMQEIHMKLKGK